MFAIGGDLEVGRLGFGAMHLPVEPGAGREASIAVVRRAVELGVTLIDTAFLYNGGGNEELLAEALHPYPDGLVVTTKVGVARPARRASGGSTDGRSPARPGRPGPAPVAGRAARTAATAPDRPGECRSPTRSARSGSCGPRGRSAGSGCPRSPSPTSTRRGRSSTSRACRTATTFSTASTSRCSPPAPGRASRSCPGGRSWPAHGRPGRDRGRRRRTRRHPDPDRARLAAGPIAGGAPDPRHRPICHLEENLAAERIELTADHRATLDTIHGRATVLGRI